MALPVCASRLFRDRKGERYAILSDPPRNTAWQLPRGHQGLTVAAIRLKRERYTWRERKGEGETAGITSACPTDVQDMTHTQLKINGGQMKMGQKWVILSVELYSCSAIQDYNYSTYFLFYRIKESLTTTEVVSTKSAVLQLIFTFWYESEALSFSGSPWWWNVHHEPPELPTIKGVFKKYFFQHCTWLFVNIMNDISILI